MTIQVILWDCLEIKIGKKFTPKSNKNIFKKNANHRIKLFTHLRGQLKIRLLFVDVNHKTFLLIIR